MFELRTLSSSTVSLAALRGRPVVLNFWASWCTGCLAEHPYLLNAWRTYRRKGVTFVGVIYDDKQTDARSFVRQYGGGWPDVLDPGQSTAINYGVYGVPETYFIDRQGIIRAKSTGMVTPALLHRWLERLSRKCSSANC
jgi:cytochrome c biogenesis protein CcmG/thiol:disulfide interchange protein DsbE